MSLSRSLFSGISGLNSLSTAMTVIGDNIANMNTVGFKSSRVTFQDILSQTITTASGMAQVGRGTEISDISSSFVQGSFESTNSSTDLAIGGEGFFIVRDPENEDNQYYTRAGEFRFDKNGYFVNPSGYIVRGWRLDPDTGEDIGSITDIKLQSFTSPPSKTDKIKVIVNLNSEAQNLSSGSNTSLSEKWDGSDADGNYISDNYYEYQTTIKVYDSLGSTHDITIYFDKGEDADNPIWEYIVTCNPAEDKRDVTYQKHKGLLARGTIEFNSGSGSMSGLENTITCELANGDGTWTALSNSDAEDNGGYFYFTPVFIEGSSMNIKLDFGSYFNGTAWANDSLSTTQYAVSSTTLLQTANGYGAGDLQSISVDPDGVITGQYSNGQVIPLYRIALAKFQNNNGLYKVGGNLYKETRISGDPITNKPGTNGLGNIASNSLEQSNVDLANEFVKMITTQRGFQANARVVTVTDQMLAELMNIKR
ncbi:MAG: flagellar basal-body rod protein FlgF [Thermoproteota archaeon]|nr:MAG: flagellar basal-body rod protein FlgF [Candidatus Korarchaeota archaeon]